MPESVESASFTSALSVMLDTAYGTVTSYAVSDGLNDGKSVPVFIVNDLRLLSVDAALRVTIIVYTFVVPFCAVTVIAKVFSPTASVFVPVPDTVAVA